MKSIWEGKGHGYLDNDGKKCMLYCFQCGQENWSCAVATGKCAWCNYDPNFVTDGHEPSRPEGQ